MLEQPIPIARGNTQQMTKSTKMPIVFFGHGSPTNALEDNIATQSWKRIADSIERPKAILCVSAHWYTHGTAVTAMETPRTIHDFGRTLPAPLFDCQYPAPGSPALAERVAELLKPTAVQMDQSWGLDHGAWAVFSKAWPDADIPIVELSVDMSRTEQWHYDIGKRLKPLRDEGILIAGSGDIVHNLSVMDGNEESPPYDWATRFNDYIKNCIVEDNPQGVLDYQARGMDATLSVPTKDHFLPLLYVLGAREEDDKLQFVSDFIQYKSLSMTSIVLGEFA